MKVNVKGLVFVGFAAAIIAGAAKADDKQIVTSKAYTDATYQTKLGGATNGIVKAGSTAGNVTYVGTATAGTDITGLTNQSTEAAQGALTTAGAVKAALDTVAATANDAQVHSTSNYSVGNSAGGWDTMTAGTNTTVSRDETSPGSEVYNVKVNVAGIGAFTNVGENGSDNTKIPQAIAVKDYVDSQLTNGGTNQHGYQETSTADFQVGGANGTWKSVTNGTYTTAGSDGNGGFKVDISDSKINNTATLPSNATSANDKLVTEFALVSALDGVDTDLSSKQDKVNGTTGVAMVGHGNGEWLAVEDTTYAKMVKYTDTTTNKDVMRIEVDPNKITTTYGASTWDSNATEANLVTEGAVADAIAAQASTDAGTYQAKSTAQSIGNGSGTWDAFTNGDYTSLARTGDATNGYTVTVDVNANTDGTFANVNTTGTAGTNDSLLPTSRAVKKYVDDQVAAQPASNIPAQNTSICTTEHPCALVAEGGTGGADEYHWRVMAISANQTNPAAGDCGDAAGTGCNAGSNG